MKNHHYGSAYRIAGNASPVNGITVIKSQDVTALSFLQAMLMGDSFEDIAKRRFNGVSGSVSKITLEVDRKGCGEFAHQQPFSSSDISKDRKETNVMKAIILDMYGVIVKQTGDDFVPYVQQTFPNLNPEEIYKPWNKADMGELTSLEVWAAIGFQGDLEKIEKDYLDTIELSDGFLDFIKAVRKKYKLAIISNDSGRWSKYLREKFNLNQYFDVISVSGDLKIRKPDERIFQLTVEKLAVKASECLYIDDRRGYLEAAGKVGMHTILFNSRNVPYEGDMVNSFKELMSRVL